MDEKEVRNYVKTYFLKNLFVTVYKYVAGIYKLYHFEEYYRELYEIHKTILNFLHRHTKKTINEMYEKFPDCVEIREIRNFLYMLKQKSDELGK